MRQVFKQPDGRYAEYSTIVDSFVRINATKEEVIAAAERYAAEEARRNYERIFEGIENGTYPSSHFSITWEEAVKNHNQNSRPEQHVRS